MRPQIGRYLVVGGGCALTQNVAIVGLVRIGMPYLVANILSATAIVPAGYLLHSLFTFRVRPNFDGFARFVVAVLFGLPVSTISLWLVHGVCKVPIGIALAMVTGMMAVYGFTLTSWISHARTRRCAVRPSDPASA